MGSWDWMRTGAVVTLAGSLAAGCVVYKGDENPDPGADGQLELSWSVGSTGCEGSGIPTIEVDLGGFVDQFDCSAGHATMSAPAGSYSLSLLGLDGDGVPRYGADAGSVMVYSGQVSQVPTVVLSALPARVDVSWRFENGGLCAPNGVSTIEAALFDEDDTLQASFTTECDYGMLTLEDVEAGAYVLKLYGREASGNVAFTGTSQVAAQRGDRISTEVVLAPGSL